MGPGVPEPELIPIKTNMHKADGGIWLILFWISACYSQSSRSFDHVSPWEVNLVAKGHVFKKPSYV